MHVPSTSPPSPLVRAAQAGASTHRLRVLFGHQSVGADILLGITEAKRTEVGEVRIEETRSPRPDPASHLLTHFRVGLNGEADAKLRDFADTVDRAADAIDVALLKFCYVDVNEPAQARQLWHRYGETFDALERRHPRIVFAHITVPLRLPPSSPLARLRQWLGAPHPEHARNRAREDFNELMRRRYSGSGTLFDLAVLESLGSRGHRCGRELDGTFVPALCRDYTHDGGHLNALGRGIAAQALLAFLFTATD